jgi:aspartyl-tRNA(Asn)/glutamyl-tRNA(Gln) amidotransferase subunit A
LKIIEVKEYITQRAQMEEDRLSISDRLFKEIDVMILPTTTSATPTIAEAKIDGPFTLDPYNTDQFNYFGLPAISIPCGFSATGMPVGLQIVGPRWGEQKVFDVAYLYQQSTKWHLKHPII